MPEWWEAVWVMLEVAVYGLVLLWLAALIPAAVITCLKNRWGLFALGWLTGGLLWFVGAAPLAPADSPWAQRFYDEEKRARAEQPYGQESPLSRVGVATALVLAVILVLGFFGSRPSPVLGLSGSALESSVGNGGRLFGTLSPCDRMDGGTWTCPRWESQFSSQVSYRVKVDGMGCWTAKLIGGGVEGGGPRYLSGCVHLLDYF